MKGKFLTALLAFAGCLAAAHVPLPSPEVRPDRTVTFRLSAPGAARVSVHGDFGAPRPMSKDPSGLWTAAVGPLDPDTYSYFFSVDGRNLADPSNAARAGSPGRPLSLVTIPGGHPWETRAVSPGSVHRHSYFSRAAGGLREFRVYTPPHYDRSRPLPVLYLLHGAGDDSSAWTAIGQAHTILDNLIADGKALPMLVVMPDGHLPSAQDSGKDPGRDIRPFEKDLLDGVARTVEETYPVETDRARRAIAGFSMGGGQALTVGLKRLDRFAWIAGFSPAAGGDPANQFPALLGNPAKVNRRIRVLWIGCGRDDRLLEMTRGLDRYLNERGISHTFVETEGGHTWRVWRRYLCDLVQILFR